MLIPQTKGRSLAGQTILVLLRSVFVPVLLVGGLRVAGSETASGTSFALTQLAPRRIFTPNGDGMNDRFTISFDNPADAVIAVAKVYDLGGAEVADLQAGSAGNTLEWDGRGHGGKIVPGGIYVYRVEVEQTVFSGTVVVAK
jgi:gliding motility-associated-like protein